MTAEQVVREIALRAREASYELALATRGVKDAALQAMADALIARGEQVLAANALDVDRAREGGTPENIIDRLRLTPDRLEGMAQGLRDVAGLPDPIGEVVRGSTLANGLELRQLRVPFGVVGMIYEARPNVTADAAGICLKSGNAVLLRGSSSAAQSNAAIVAVLRDAVAASGLPADVIQLVPAESRESVKALMRARGLVDVLIPRGGAGLIRTVVEESIVPVIETGIGNVHVYVDKAADLEKALAIVLNSKTHRTSVCNSAESLLVHADIADDFLPKVVAALQESGVSIHGDEAFCGFEGVTPATDEDWATEYLALEIAAAVVP
ncbi:MAG: glutamate-5-semialdehyde dehydrogenase, partial [Nocardioides sp.]